MTGPKSPMYLIGKGPHGLRDEAQAGKGPKGPLGPSTRQSGDLPHPTEKARYHCLKSPSGRHRLVALDDIGIVRPHRCSFCGYQLTLGDGLLMDRDTAQAASLMGNGNTPIERNAALMVRLEDWRKQKRCKAAQ